MVVLMAVSACKEPEGIGLDVLPEGEEMPIAWIDTFTVEAKTVKFDSVRTSGRGTYVIGDFGDPIFGRVQSQLFTQFKLNAEPAPFSSDDVLDSIVLNLDYAGSYGRIDKLRGTHHFGVFEITDDMVEDTTYYSDDTFIGASGTPLAEATFKPDLLNSVFAGEDTLGSSFRIRLPDGYGQRILNSDSLNDNLLFSDQFKGLNIRSLSLMMPSDFGSLLYFDMESADSRVELYYHNDEDTVQYLFNINNQNAIYTSVTHEFTNDLIDAMDPNMDIGDTRLYVQSLAGTRIRLSFPHLRELNNLGAVAINKAELVLPVDETSLDDFGLPSILSLSGVNAGDSAFVIIDSFEPNGIDYYGGIYDKDNQEYVFNVARHLQSILTAPDEADYGIYIASLNAIDGRRGVFNGPLHPDTPLKLRMTYTIID